MEYLEDGTITYKHTRRDKLRTIFVIVTKRTDVKTIMLVNVINMCDMINKSLYLFNWNII
jgi:hypothetical protein